MVAAGRCCWGAGAGAVGRVGARETGARPADLLRAIVTDLCCFLIW